MKLWKNEDARVPLALIGVLFVLISTATSLHLSQMDARMASSMTKDTDINAADTALLYARADLARIVNYAGMEALKQMGETPVIAIDPNSQYNPGGETPDVAEFNRNWAKGMMTHTMNQYIESNYMYDRYQYRGYAVNVEPITSWNTTDIIPIYMALDRDLDPPLLAPNETYQTYWKATVPLTISIVDLASGDTIDEQDIIVGNLILARYPLLESLTTEYETRLNGSNALMTETTAFAMGYTWARGYLQYSKSGNPKNIVDNEHLSLIVNGALMLDQGFVFNSVDPASIIEYGMQTKKTLEGKKDITMGEFICNTKLDNGSFIVDPNADAAYSTGDPDNASKALDEALHFDYNATPITDLLNNDSLPGGSATRQQINKIIPQVYKTKLATGVARQTNVDIGAHKGYNSNHKTYSWGEPDNMRRLEVLPRDTSVPGNLYGEVWEVTWTRKHVWRHYYTVKYPCMKTSPLGPYMGICYRREYNEMTAIDTRVDKVVVTLKAEENSKTNTHLDYDGSTLSTGNDVVKAFTSRDVIYTLDHTDSGLEEAYKSYKSGIFDPKLIANIKNMNLDSDNCDPKTFDVAPPGWLKGEAQDAVDEINRQIRSDVHLSPDINYMEYPNPADAMRATAIDITNKIKANQTRYANKDRYYSGGKYSSCSAKTISQVREWYVDEVLYQVNKQYMAASENINDQIDANFSDSADDVREANNNGASLLKSALCFPIGLTMRAEHVMDDGTKYDVDELPYWDENVTLMVDMEPDYLDPIEPYPGESFYTLKLRNINLLGSTGAYVLPSMNPWVCTVNSWMIEVEGEIVEFTVLDVDNEVHPNPMFGHEAQIYKRRIDPIRDPTTNRIIGDNSPITFSFITGTFLAVPSGKITGVGDKATTENPNPYLEESGGW
ncbi:MAG: hypothetical protein C5S45_06505 [Candidatus Methanocomedens sp.]|nr:MAG: hypothetical protein C5S45_06505 [ANME-2 cluster archaeon]